MNSNFLILTQDEVDERRNISQNLRLIVEMQWYCNEGDSELAKNSINELKVLSDSVSYPIVQENIQSTPLVRIQDD